MSIYYNVFSITMSHYLIYLFLLIQTLAPGSGAVMCLFGSWSQKDDVRAFVAEPMWQELISLFLWHELGQVDGWNFSELQVELNFVDFKLSSVISTDPLRYNTQKRAKDSHLLSWSPLPTGSGQFRLDASGFF